MLRYAPVALALAIAGTAAPAFAQDSEFVGIAMFGEYVPQGEGEEDALGDFDGEFDMAGGQICYYLDLDGVTGATGLAIHSGERGENGPMVARLRLPADPLEEECVAVEADVQRAILADREGHYMVVTAPMRDNGAIRGQLID
ncbi:CHRD domain-containing protein [Aurantiacibacter sp. MUD61]|uniref:CHRD domain-containing protein n=1 Tax=Aurantiacibacter sp. MUD61 TaxID=3009083 RepID=UPI0022F016AC|nr:CHRD domain-containing protein [Aurantiacibacter sp. MUD61]